MITILAVGPGADKLSALAAGDPSVEVMTAAGAEDALEKLARNRRIDAVFLAGPADAAGIARLIREEDPGAPPLFGPASIGAVPGVRAVAEDPPGRIVAAIAHLLNADR